MGLAKIRLKNITDRKLYGKEFLKDLDVDGYLYVKSVAYYEKFKKGESFITVANNKDMSGIWYHYLQTDFEEVVEFVMPSELFEI